jgi:Signal peptidase, peptidase S26
LRHARVVHFPCDPATKKPLIKGWPSAATTSAGQITAMKPVVGTAGDTICRSSEGIFSVNGVALGTAAGVGHDGHPLPSWTGCKVLKADEIAVFADCWLCLDSRFYGSVPKSSATVYRLGGNNNAGNVRAFVSVRIGDVSILGCKIVQQPGQRPWVAMPDRQWVADDGTTRWSPVIKLSNPLKRRLDDAVLAVWERP